MTGLRERNKALRTAAILDATVELLSEQTIDDTTTEQIADRAGVSPATVYNLVGTREQLLRALVQRVVDDLVDAVAQATASDDDPISVAELIVDHSVDAFTAHSPAYRQVVAAGRNADRVPGESWVDPSQLQVAALFEARDLGILRSDADPTGLGRQIYISWIGAMEHWANGQLDDRGFVVAARHGLATVLAAGAVDEHRPRFIERLATLSAELERCWNRPRTDR